jgi:hypothetical protein
MREIKFRAWDGTRMDYNPWFDEYAGGGAPINSFANEAKMFNKVFMQWTGLYDTSGKEIYEGDIVEVEDGVGVIEWNAHDLAWDLSGPNMPITRSMSAKVIGNIYENPELLKIQ